MTDEINAKMPTSLKEALEILNDSRIQKAPRSRSGIRNLARFVDSHVTYNQDAKEEMHHNQGSDSPSKTVINFRSKMSHIRRITENSTEQEEVDAKSLKSTDVGIADFPAMSLAASTSAADEKVESTNIRICINGKSTAVFKIGDRVLINAGGGALGEDIIIADFSFPLSPSEIGTAYLEVQGLRLEQLKRLILKVGRPTENEIDART